MKIYEEDDVMMMKGENMNIMAEGKEGSPRNPRRRSDVEDSDFGR